MVGIIYCSDLNRAPFIQKYIDIMNKCDCEYRIILWDRQLSAPADGEELL